MENKKCQFKEIYILYWNTDIYMKDEIVCREAYPTTSGLSITMIICSELHAKRDYYSFVAENMGYDKKSHNIYLVFILFLK